MALSMERIGSVTVVVVDGQLTINNRGEFKERVMARIANGDTNFVVDFAQADYIDSSGLGVLISISKRIGEANGSLALSALNEDLQTLFRLTKLDSLFSIAESREAALAACEA